MNGNFAIWIKLELSDKIIETEKEEFNVKKDYFNVINTKILQLPEPKLFTDEERILFKENYDLKNTQNYQKLEKLYHIVLDKIQMHKNLEGYDLKDIKIFSKVAKNLKHVGLDFDVFEQIRLIRYQKDAIDMTRFETVRIRSPDYERLREHLKLHVLDSSIKLYHELKKESSNEIRSKVNPFGKYIINLAEDIYDDMLTKLSKGDIHAAQKLDRFSGVINRLGRKTFIQLNNAFIEYTKEEISFQKNKDNIMYLENILGTLYKNFALRRYDPSGDCLKLTEKYKRRFESKIENQIEKGVRKDLDKKRLYLDAILDIVWVMNQKAEKYITNKRFKEQYRTFCNLEKEIKKYSKKVELYKFDFKKEHTKWYSSKLGYIHDFVERLELMKERYHTRKRKFDYERV